MQQITGSSGDTLTRVECSVPFPVVSEPFTLSKVKPGDKLMLALVLIYKFTEKSGRIFRF